MRKSDNTARKARLEGEAMEREKLTTRHPDANTAARKAMADHKDEIAQKAAKKPDVQLLGEIISRFKETFPLDWQRIARQDTNAGLNDMIETMREGVRRR